MKTRVKASFAVATAVATAFALSSCTTVTPPGATAAPSSAASVASADELVSGFAGLDFSQVTTRIESESNKLLAEAADAVITGTITGWSTGTTMAYEGGGIAMTSIVAEVSGVRVLQGDAREGETVYVGMMGGDGTDAFAKELPVGVSVVAYLNRSDDHPKSSSEDVTLVNANGGRPPGSQLWVFSDMQGFAVEVDPSEVYWPLIGIRSAGPLAGTYPDGDLVGVSAD